MLYIENFRNVKLLVDECGEFVDAAASGNVISVKQMIDRGMHPDTQGPKGWTALRKASARNKYEVAFELLKRGAGVDTTNYTGQTALMMASAYGHHEMVSLLLSNGADPNITNCGGRTALMISASYGHILVVGALIGAGLRIDINKIDRIGKSALQMALDSGHVDVAKMLEVAGGKCVGNFSNESDDYGNVSGGTQ